MKKVYLVLTHTNTKISKLIKLFSKSNYSHASISLDEKCNKMYSFGRKYLYFPFIGSFNKEDINKGLFLNKNATMSLYEIDVTDEQYNEVIKKIDQIKKTNKGYNIIGLLLAFFRIKLHRNKYYCSEFIYEVLSSKKINIYQKNKIRFKPVELVKSNFKKLYEGKISDFINS